MALSKYMLPPYIVESAILLSSSNNKVKRTKGCLIRSGSDSLFLYVLPLLSHQESGQEQKQESGQGSKQESPQETIPRFTADEYELPFIPA